MSGKQALVSAPAASGINGPASTRPLANVFIAVAFFAFVAGYLVLYLATDLPTMRGEVSRADLLRFRLLLPEQAAERWFGGSPSFLTLFDRWPVLLMAAAIVTTGWLTGRLLLAVVRVDRHAAGGGPRPPTLRPLERFVFSCGVGLNAVSLYVLAAGLAGAINRWCFIVPGSAIAAVSVWRAWLGRPADPIASVHSRKDDGISKHWLWLAAPFAAVILLGGVLPPLDFDVREYHLQAPKEFFQQGSIGFLPHNVYANMPLGSEMFSLLGMVLLGDWWLGALVGKTVIASFALLTALALCAAGERFASKSAGMVAAVLYLSIPWVSVVSTSGLVEGVLAFYLLLAVYAVLLWRQVSTRSASEERPSLVPPGASTSDAPLDRPVAVANDGLLALAGFCSGAAVSCKYPAVLFVALPLLVQIACHSAKRPWKPLALYSLSLLAGCGLWFGKNWVLTGNPVYPLLYEWLGGATRTPDINARWLRAHLPHEFGLTTLKDSLSAMALKSAWLSPVLVPFAVLGLFVRRYRWLALALGGYFAYIIATWWLFTHRIDRFWIPALPLLALLGGLGAVWSTSLAWRRMVLATLVVALSISFIYVTAHEVTYNAYFVSLPDARSDTNRVNGWYLALNSNVPAGCSVLSVGDAQVFDFDVPVIYNTVFDESAVAAICQGRDAAGIAAELRRRNISHVFVNWSEVYRYRQPGNYGGIPDFITPEWFASLVEKGVFDTPWQIPTLPNQEVYPVTAVCAAVQGQTAPEIVPAKTGQ